MEDNTNISFLSKITSTIKNFSSQERLAFAFLSLLFLAGVFGIVAKSSDRLSTEVPKQGGVIKEGIVGTPRFINPLLEISDVDRDLTALIYSGLMRPDGNGSLILDLASNYKASEDGLSYEFTLKKDAKWHDGKPVTSDDVIFTIKQAKDQSLKSPKRASWEGVSIEKINDLSFKFILEQPYTPFLENTTLGILPLHIWKEAPLAQMGFSEFNIKPIGSGPYKIGDINRNSSGIATSYELVRNTKFILGKPYIKKIILKFYPNEKKLVEAFKDGKIDNISGISPEKITKLTLKEKSLKVLTLPRVFGVFFNQNNAPVFAKTEVRKALNKSIDRSKIIEEVLKGFGTEIDSPIPPGTFGSTEIEPQYEGLEKAREILEENGWKFNDEEGLFVKKNKKDNLRLEFTLSTSNTPELKKTAELIKLMWEEMGAKVNLKIFEISDLNQNVIRPRKYDALLFGEILGRDPDPFAFWHSSQRNDPGLNIALYANITVDDILERARKNQNQKEREEDYKKFQEEVKKDSPAIFLYSPSYIYLTTEKLKGFNTPNIVLPSERFSGIYNWHLKTKKVINLFTR